MELFHEKKTTGKSHATIPFRLKKSFNLHAYMKEGLWYNDKMSWINV
jgi:hypothetical protein